MTRTLKHSIATRLVHMGLAIAVTLQLLTSLILVAPAPDATGNVWFEVHEYSGLSAMTFVLLFWLVVTARHVGTGWGMLFPWLSRARLAAVWADVKAHFAALRHLRLPIHDDRSPLASAVHGLGLLLITAMASSGTLYYFINAGNPDAGGLIGVAMFIHLTLANLVWAYLIGHAGLAVLQHFLGTMRLSEMWSLRRAKPE